MAKVRNYENVASEKKPIDPKVLAAIGTIVGNASDLDDLISLMLFKVSGMEAPADGFIIIGQLAVSQKIARLDVLLSRKGSPLKHVFAQLAQFSVQIGDTPKMCFDRSAVYKTRITS
ncbi:MAG: hypothetical protein EXR29_14740 [Betaproteobacteria bacterium]|nr:hypothetical protein [Betaproteobacteria bacterium]